MNEVFYHASNCKDLKELLPLSVLHGSNEKVCYFTPIRAYALFYLRDLEINHVTCGLSANGIVVYHEQFPDQLRTIYQGRNGFIYTCKDNGHINMAHTNGVWAANKPVTISEMEYVEDAYAEILKAEKSGDVQVIRYESLSDEKKQEIIEMMKNYILKNKFLSSDSKKARFFIKNFPEASAKAKNTEEKRKFLIVDGHNLLFQMFFGMPSRITGKDGKAIHGTLGFVGALIKMIKMVKPTHIVGLFDGEHDNPRAELSGEYKANRIDYTNIPDMNNPFSQLADIYTALDCMGIPHTEIADF